MSLFQLFAIAVYAVTILGAVVSGVYFIARLATSFSEFKDTVTHILGRFERKFETQDDTLAEHSVVLAELKEWKRLKG